ncbi:TPA: NAD-dependent epimerase/dehydratase family protein, partial [Pseudomonas aeruginosa]|nr:NAD-dependent epimerase/dehydratase family protein [Pseudomonas aeruginosa]
MVTGASGFVGSALCCELARTGYAVIAVVRRVVERIPSVTYIEADLTDPATFAGEFPTVDCIIHLAGRAHILTDKVADPLAAFREVNRDATVRLATRALEAGVKRFVFVSSIG